MRAPSSYFRRSVVACAVLAGAQVGCAPPPPPEPVEKTRALTVMTINLRNNADFWEERIALLAAEIARLKPDLVGLQEVQINADQGLMVMEAITAIDPELVYGYDDRLKTGVAEFLGEGIGLFFRGEQVARASLPLSDGRVAIMNRVQLEPGLTIDLYDTHLEAGDGAAGDGDETRRLQAEAINAWMEEDDPGHARFLTGDMNATPEKPAIAAFTGAGLVDTWPLLHPDEDGATSPVHLAKEPDYVQSFTRRIDYIFVDAAADDATIAAQDAVICFDAPNDEGLYPSDHLGVTTTFEVTFTVPPAVD